VRIVFHAPQYSGQSPATPQILPTPEAMRIPACHRRRKQSLPSSIIFRTISFSVSVSDPLFPASMHPLLSSISNGVIHPGLSSGCNLELESLTILARSPCTDAPSGLASLACVVLSRWYCCKFRSKSLVHLSNAGLFSADNISRCVGDGEDWSVDGGATARVMGL
jgi:hypothetical protein